MPSVVIKPFRDRDEYVVWSTVTESPHGYGNRVEMALLLRAGIRGQEPGDLRNPEAVLDRADVRGTSDFTGWAGWDDASLIFKQVGLLPRAALFEVAQMMGAVGGCRLRDILVHVEPFEDDDGRDHYADVVARHGDDVISLEGEREIAGLALGQLKATIESWNR